MLTSFDLPCTGACMYAGAYALSPVIPVTSGEVILRAEAFATGSGTGTLRLIAVDAAGNELAAAVRDVANAGGLATWALWLTLPANTAGVRLRVESTHPYSTVTVDRVRVLNYP